jgi:hypothetical protein
VSEACAPLGVSRSGAGGRGRQWPPHNERTTHMSPQTSQCLRVKACRCPCSTCGRCFCLVCLLDLRFHVHADPHVHQSGSVRRRRQLHGKRVAIVHRRFLPVHIFVRLRKLRLPRHLLQRSMYLHRRLHRLRLFCGADERSVTDETALARLRHHCNALLSAHLLFLLSMCAVSISSCFECSRVRLPVSPHCDETGCDQISLGVYNAGGILYTPAYRSTGTASCYNNATHQPVKSYYRGSLTRSTWFRRHQPDPDAEANAHAGVM